MNINSNAGHALINLLEHANRTGQFVAVKSGQFVLIDSKNEALKSTDINKFAQQIFSQSKNLTPTQKNNLIGRSTLASKEYAARLPEGQFKKNLNDLPDIQFKGNLNGLPDIQLRRSGLSEIKLSGLPDIQISGLPDIKLGELPNIQLSGSKLPDLKQNENLPTSQINPPASPTLLKMSNPKNEAILHKEERRIHLNDKFPVKAQFKIFYAKVLENIGFHEDALEGVNQSLAIKSYLSDLEAYAQKFPENKVPIKLKLAIDDLRQAYECALFASSITNGVVDRNELNSLIKEFSQRINDLPISKKEDPPCVILPGGFSGDEGGHAILYKIEKTSTNEFSFTIINTGGGADLVGVNKNKRVMTADVKYSGLKSSDLTPEFLTILLDKMNHKDMDDVKSLINGQFPYAAKSLAGTRTIQLNGTCAFKSTSTYLHDRLGNDLHNSFKFFTTKREFQNLSKLRNSEQSRLLSQEDREKMDDLLQKGTQVLKNRSNKLTGDYPV
ncbi:MAG: hypothetical protein H0T62_03930 [Parachlamydiaceae bacterium]|nr:hypothetical protein [Parachlamydiaceae bacterium]